MSGFPARAVVRVTSLLFLIAAMGGCATNLILPSNEPAAPVDLSANAATTTLGPTPATVRHLDRKIRYLSLMESTAIALENGYTGIDSARAPGLANDNLATFNGDSASGGDSIRVFALQPAIAAAGVDASLARFDVQAFANQTWRTFDEPVQGLNSFSNGQNATLDFGLAKPLATGGIAGLTWKTDYSNLSQPPRSVINPRYFTRLQFGVEQPLLLDSGVYVNQLLAGFPRNGLYPTVNSRSGTDGILISRVRSEQQRAEFERRVNLLLLNVEAAYWNLYAAYIDLYTTDQALRMATEVWRIAKEQFPEKIDEGDYAGTRAQLQFFRGNRLQNIGRILDAERNLRLLIGLNVEDGERIVPIDAPTTQGLEPEWHASLREALSKRPELTLAREEIRRNEFQLDAQLNRLQPDLRFVATYEIVGLGSRLDGSDQFVDFNGVPQTSNALRSLAGTHYANWTLGLRYNMPIGFRAEFAGVRKAKLELNQAYYVLQEQETKATSYLAKQYSRLIELADFAETRRQQRLALADQLDVRFRKFAAGKLPVDFLQDSVRQWATALSTEYRAVAEYNTAIAAFHFGKGTLMEYDNVKILEGTPSIGEPVNAVEFEKSRTQTLIRRCENRVSPAIEGPFPNLPSAAAVAPAGPPELPALYMPAKHLAPPPALPNATARPEPVPPAIQAENQSSQAIRPLRVTGLGSEVR